MTAMDEMCALLTSWGMDPGRIPINGLYREGYENWVTDEDGVPSIDIDSGFLIEAELHPYPEGFPYMQAMEIYERHLEERCR